MAWSVIKAYVPDHDLLLLHSIESFDYKLFLFHATKDGLVTRKWLVEHDHELNPNPKFLYFRFPVNSD